MLMSSRVVTQARSDVRHRIAVTCWLLFLAAGAVSLLATRAVGQDAGQGAGQQGKYDSVPIHNAVKDPQVVRRMESAARMFATTRDLNGFQDKKAAVYYFERYVPAKITQPDAVSEISSLVGDAMGLLSRAQRSGAPASQQILPALFKGMRGVAQGNYHPAARINATLALGRMNLRPAERAAGNPPVPLSHSYDVLFALYQDESAPDGVRAAALQGLLRHAKLRFPAMSDEQRTALAAEMAKLLESEAPEGRSESAHAYLQRFAIDVLDVLRDPADKQLGEQLVAISTERKRPDLIALYSAARLGRFNGQLGDAVGSPANILEKWSARALQAFQDELARIEALERPDPASKQPPPPDQFLQRREEPQAAAAGGYEDMMMGEEDMMMGEDMMGEDMMGEEMMMGEDMMMEMGMGMGMTQPRAKPQPPEVLISRRKLNHVLEQLHRGVSGSAEVGVPRQPGGLLAAVGEANQPAINDWLASIEQVVTNLNDEMHDDRKKYVAALNEQILVLRDLAGDEADAVEMEAGPDAGDGEAAPADPLQVAPPMAMPTVSAPAAP